MREVLEAALRGQWTRENLTVYGDFLQSQDDPRGELIALDLHAATHARTPDIEARRRALIGHLLGPQLAALVGDCVHYGFLRDLRVSEHTYDKNVEALFDTPLGGYVRSATLYGEATKLKKYVTMLGRHRHPWLRHLRVSHTESYMTKETEAFISEGGTRKLVAATPVLERLDILQGARNRKVFPAFTHPTARVVTTSWHARTDDKDRRILVWIASSARGHGLTYSRIGPMLAQTALSDDGRLAWLDVTIAFGDLLRRCEHRPFPAATLRRAVEAIDVSQPHAQDWAPVRAELAGYTRDVVQIACD